MEERKGEGGGKGTWVLSDKQLNCSSFQACKRKKHLEIQRQWEIFGARLKDGLCCTQHFVPYSDPRRCFPRPRVQLSVIQEAAKPTVVSMWSREDSHHHPSCGPPRKNILALQLLAAYL